MKREAVVIVGMLEPYTADIDADIWGVNRCYKHQEKLDRLYFLDNLDVFEPEFAESVNALGIPVFCQKHYEEIEQSRPYPLDEVLQAFGVSYFTSTIAYMMAHAIKEGYKKIVLHQILSYPHAPDYMDQKPCLDFWSGIAIAKGVQIVVTGSGSICKPFPWQAQRYGYEKDRMMIKHLMSKGMTLQPMSSDAERVFPNAVSA